MRVRIRDKGVNCSPICTLCNTEEEEDRFHLFFRCPGSSNIWSMWNAFSIISGILTQNHDINVVIFNVLQVITADDATLFGCVLWRIWKQRNNKIWNDITDAQSYVFDRAKTMLKDWKTTRSIQDTSSNRQQSKRNVKWMKPNAGRVKCNIDASFCKLSNRVGI